jgi:ectoine hydroxylase
MTTAVIDVPLLTPEFVATYQTLGYSLLPEYFSPESIWKLRNYAQQIGKDKNERTVFEADGTTVRSVYGIHYSNGIMGRLARHPLLVGTAQQILGGEVYVYQSKINWKTPFTGTEWDWHQDFTYWKNQDSMPAPRAINIVILLHALIEFNGPLYFVPGSHRLGTAQYTSLKEKPAGYSESPDWISSLTAKINYSIEKQRLAEIVKEHGIIAPKAKAGSVLMFDSNLIHASPPNITPFERTMIIFTYNHVNNAPPESKRRRPEFLSSADSRPITSLNDWLSETAAEQSNGGAYGQS